MKKQLRVRFGSRLRGSLYTRRGTIDFEAVPEAEMWRVTTCDQMDLLVDESRGMNQFRVGSDTAGRQQLWFVG